MKELKVGDSFEVVEAIGSFYPNIYNKGCCGVVVDEFDGFGISAIIGPKPINNQNTGWAVEKGNYKKVGKLTITKLKI